LQEALGLDVVEGRGAGGTGKSQDGPGSDRYKQGSHGLQPFSVA
jgi:hypothetical protein